MKSPFSIARSTGPLLCGLAVTLASLTSPADAASTSLVISGTPPATVALGQNYSFQPTATDSRVSRIKFNITNKPSWAVFDETTGLLSGKPVGHVVGTYSDISIRLTDWYGYVTLPTFSIKVTATASTASSTPTVSNTPPTISGQPLKSVSVGSAYTFMPTAADANGDALTFSIQNKPSWATFSKSTGALTGTASAGAVGTYANVTISVSDGKATVSLPAFTLTVDQISTGNATLEWTPPTENTDGSVLSNLAGYRLHYGSSANSLTQTVQVSNPGLTTYVVENLSAGTWYFAVTSYTTSGVESSLSGVVSSSIL
jgi:hypothetical protein